MKNFWIDSQKGKIIQIMILKWADKFYQDFELEKYYTLFHNIFVWNNSWPRLSQLLKDWIVEVLYFENTNKHWYHKAKYRLKSEFIPYYKKLYNLK